MTDTVVFSGMFTLKDDVTEEQFIPAFRAFYDHMLEKGFATSYRLIRREPLEPFGTRLMPFTYHAELEVPDMEMELASLAYTMSHAEPVHSLHVAMRSMVAPMSADFFHGTCIASG